MLTPHEAGGSQSSVPELWEAGNLPRVSAWAAAVPRQLLANIPKAF